uniref:RNase H type-1 domain-containing protein n=1 Tax=Cannabis sativa TaxID=3483 RepID=A0A803P5H0_CANSA
MLTFVENLIKGLSGTEIGRKEILTYLGCIVDQVWMSRNQSCREGVSCHIDEVQSRVKNVYGKYSNFSNGNTDAEVGPSQAVPTERKGNWRTIQEVEWILCTDASWYKGEVELATVLINKNTDYWTKKTEYNKAISALDAELTAISMALSWALEEGRYEIHILSDCQIAVQALDKFLTSL